MLPVWCVYAVSDERQPHAGQRPQAELAQHLHMAVTTADEDQILLQAQSIA